MDRNVVLIGFSRLITSLQTTAQQVGTIMPAMGGALINLHCQMLDMQTEILKNDDLKFIMGESDLHKALNAMLLLQGLPAKDFRFYCSEATDNDDKINSPRSVAAIQPVLDGIFDFLEDGNLIDLWTSTELSLSASGEYIVWNHICGGDSKIETVSINLHNDSRPISHVIKSRIGEENLVGWHGLSNSFVLSTILMPIVEHNKINILDKIADWEILRLIDSNIMVDYFRDGKKIVLDLDDEAVVFVDIEDPYTMGLDDYKLRCRTTGKLSHFGRGIKRTAEYQESYSWNSIRTRTQHRLKDLIVAQVAEITEKANAEANTDETK